MKYRTREPGMRSRKPQELNSEAVERELLWACWLVHLVQGRQS